MDQYAKYGTLIHPVTIIQNFDAKAPNYNKDLMRTVYMYQF